MKPFREPFLCDVSVGKLSASSGSIDSSGGDIACLSIRTGKRRQSMRVARDGGNLMTVPVRVLNAEVR
jgi:hypothetical protein